MEEHPGVVRVSPTGAPARRQRADIVRRAGVRRWPVIAGGWLATLE